MSRSTGADQRLMTTKPNADTTTGDEGGRSRTIALTAKGRALIDDRFPRHVENERRLLAGLSADEQSQLAGLLDFRR